MKKIRNYVYTLLIALISVFVMQNTKLLAEEVVVNPNSSNKATYIYTVKEKDGNKDDKGNPTYVEVERQFVKSRDVVVYLDIDDETLATYDSKYTICEIIPENNAGNSRELKECSTYLTSKKNNSIQLRGRGDGEKVIEINLFSSYASNSIAKTITKKIFLDTTGPVITLNGSEYLYLTSEEKYKEDGATCQDANEVVGYTCNVQIDDAKIDTNNGDYQYIKYTASDVLGNEVSVYRKVLVEIKEKKSYTGWFIGGGFVLVVFLLSGYLVIKNKEKQRNQSVL